MIDSATVNTRRLRLSDMGRLSAVGLRTRKLRAGLSALGIAIGVAAIVAVLGLSQSSSAGLRNEISALGTNLLTVTNGQSITGGYVYRGKALPIAGVYIYGDYQSGRIWGVRAKDGQAIESGELTDVNKSKVDVSAFGEDHEGDLLILSLQGGKIYRLVPAGS